MKSNFVTAVTSRWTLSTWQTNRLNFLASTYGNQISSLLGTVQNILDTRYDYSVYPLQAVVTGIYDRATGSSATNAAGITGVHHSEHKIDPGCTEPPDCPKIQDVETSCPF